MFKDGTSTYDLIDLVILKDLDFQNREKDEVLELLGEDFEYDLALNAKNYEIPDNFIIIPQNTIITENSGYYVTVTFKETTIGLKRDKNIKYYTNGGLVESLPKNSKLLYPSWGFTPIIRENNSVTSVDKDRILRLLKEINILNFNMHSLMFFSACIWGNNAVVQDRTRCYVINLRNKKKIKDLRDFKLYGVLDNKPILINNQTGQNVLLELNKHLSLIKF